ncbi:MAG: 3-hydroxybutyryl-CoA dehydrogenase [Syntrophomonadaceae bacterium]|jgi:3-hydroxybutyryl-CoA dehydrogenase|nr:3-hydroxybutyryl-CoA dehydrogenase [Syntrophomonadaceae bacterium]
MFSLTFIGGNNIGVKKIAILGAGVMGAGIAQAAVHGGYEVIIRDLQMTLVQKGLSTIYNSLKEKVQAHEITNEELELMKSRLTGTTDLTLIHDADMVIEAIIENASVKKQVFAELDNHCREDTILGTNTSTLSISEIASATKNPQRVIGVHFFYPVPAMELVEVVKGLQTSEDTVTRTLEVIGNMGKKAIVVQRESPGFVVNRILASMINEAIWVYGEGLASAEDIDTAIKLETGMKKGPLELADILGLDTLYSGIMSLYEEFKDPKYRPHPSFTTMVRSGYLGRKTGQGFYRYE